MVCLGGIGGGGCRFHPPKSNLLHLVLQHALMKRRSSSLFPTLLHSTSKGVLTPFCPLDSIPGIRCGTTAWPVGTRVLSTVNTGEIFFSFNLGWHYYITYHLLLFGNLSTGMLEGPASFRPATVGMQILLHATP